MAENTTSLFVLVVVRDEVQLSHGIIDLLMSCFSVGNIFHVAHIIVCSRMTRRMSKIVEITEPIDADAQAGPSRGDRKTKSLYHFGKDDRNNSFGTYLKVRMTAELGQGETETKTTRISKAAPEPL